MEKRHVPAYLSLWLFDLFIKNNEEVFAKVDENGKPVLQEYTGEDGKFPVLVIYQNDATATLIKRIERVKGFKFNELVKSLVRVNDLHIEISDSYFYANRNAYTKGVISNE